MAQRQSDYDSEDRGPCFVPGCEGPGDYLIHDPSGFDTLEEWICGWHVDELAGHHDS